MLLIWVCILAIIQFFLHILPYHPDNLLSFQTIININNALCFQLLINLYQISCQFLYINFNPLPELIIHQGILCKFINHLLLHIGRYIPHIRQPPLLQPTFNNTLLMLGYRSSSPDKAEIGKCCCLHPVPRHQCFCHGRSLNCLQKHFPKIILMELSILNQYEAAFRAIKNVILLEYSRQNLLCHQLLSLADLGLEPCQHGLHCIRTIYLPYLYQFLAILCDVLLIDFPYYFKHELQHFVFACSTALQPKI